MSDWKTPARPQKGLAHISTVLLVLLVIALLLASWYRFGGGREQVQAWIKTAQTEVTAPAPTPAAPAAPAAQASASAASAPEQAASAANSVASAPVASAPAAPAAAATATLAPAATAKTEEDNDDTNQGDSIIDYTVQRGDQMMRLWGKHWDEVCDLNQTLGTVKDCNWIYVGQTLKHRAAIIPAVRHQAKATVTAAKAPKPAAIVVTKPAATPTSTGEFPWVKISGAPLRGCGNKDAPTINEESWADYISRGLMTEAERTELRQLTKGMREPNISLLPEEGRVDLIPGMHFLAVSFCGKDGKATSRTNVRGAWDAVKTGPVYGQQFRLKSTKQDDSAMDTVWVWVRSCHNWVIRRAEKLRPQASPPSRTEPPVVKHTPPPPPPPAPAASAPVVPRVAELPPMSRKRYWETAERLYITGSYDRNSNAHSLSGAFYPYVQREPWGRFLAGGAIELSQWEGTNRGFDFEGHQAAWGPEVRWQLDKGHDVSLALLAGSIKERGSQGAYAMDRRCKVLGPSVVYTNYVRELREEKFAPEFSAFLSILYGQSCEGDHMWFGQTIADKAQLLRLNHLVQAGFRIIMVKTENWRFFLQAGFFEEDSNARTASVRFGISDKYKIIFVGAGWNFDLLNGGEVPGWGFAIDVMRGIYVYRNHVLEREALEAIVRAGGAVHNGLVFVRTSPAEPVVTTPTTTTTERPD